jgi:hypothetical protein
VSIGTTLQYAVQHTHTHAYATSETELNRTDLTACQGIDRVAAIGGGLGSHDKTGVAGPRDGMKLAIDTYMLRCGRRYRMIRIFFLCERVSAFLLGSWVFTKKMCLGS